MTSMSTTIDGGFIVALLCSACLLSKCGSACLTQFEDCALQFLRRGHYNAVARHYFACVRVVLISSDLQHIPVITQAK